MLTACRLLRAVSAVARGRFCIVLFCALALAPSRPAVAQSPLYWITDIRSGKGFPEAMNASGQIVLNGGGAFLWLPTPAYGRPAGLNNLPGATSGFGINDLGQVVGGANSHGFLWLPSPAYGLSAGRNDLGAANGNLFSGAFCINNYGEVGGFSSPGTNSIYAAVYGYGIWTYVGAPVGTVVYGINDSAQAVGSPIPNVHGHAFLWLPFSDYGLPAGLNDLGSLGGDSIGQSINMAGQVVGVSGTSSGDQHAFLWQNGQMTDLGTLGGLNSYAFRINASGQIVGTAQNADGSNRAVRWQNGQITDLNSLIDPASGWLLTTASANNASGQIAGVGINSQGTTDAFLLTPIDYITPTQGGNAGLVSVTLVYPRLQSGATVKLVGSGQPDILGSPATTVFYDPNFQTTVMKTTFDLTGATPGPRSVVVSQPDSTALTMSSTFTIEIGGAPDVRVRILGADKILGGNEAIFTLEIANQGNLDAVEVPIWLAGLPNQNPPSLDFALNNVSAGSYSANFLSTPTQDMLSLILSRLPAGSVRTLQFRFTPSLADASAYQLPLHAWISPA